MRRLRRDERLKIEAVVVDKQKCVVLRELEMEVVVKEVTKVGEG